MKPAINTNGLPYFRTSAAHDTAELTLLNDIYRRADSLSVFALRAVSADLNPVNREKMRLECKVLLAELHDLHQALDAMEVQP